MVVKVGSSSLTQPSGHLDVKKLNSLVAALSAASAQGARVVLVSSGAIAAGFGRSASRAVRVTWRRSRPSPRSARGC